MPDRILTLSRELHAAETAFPRDAARYAAVLERTLAACAADPAAAAFFDVSDLRMDLMMEYQTLRRYDDALVLADELVASGYRMNPDTRCLRAELLLQAGRADEAAPIWASVRADAPDDTWLYNVAGMEYRSAGDHETALGWLTDGLELALRTGDRERLAGQLVRMRRESLDTLGLPSDELQERATPFLRALEQARERHADAAPPAEASGGDGRGRDDDLKIAFSWLPADEYGQVVLMWPELAGSELVRGPNGTKTHAQYCRSLQERLVGHADAGMTGMFVAPLRVAPFTAWCTERGEQPDGSDARADYAGHQARIDDPSLIPWPPGRNEPCWCASGRKYKKCCAAPGSESS